MNKAPGQAGAGYAGGLTPLHQYGLRDRQTFVPNIFFAKPGDYRKAEITILRSKAQPTAVWLPVVK